MPKLRIHEHRISHKFLKIHQFINNIMFSNITWNVRIHSVFNNWWIPPGITTWIWNVVFACQAMQSKLARPVSACLSIISNGPHIPLCTKSNLGTYLWSTIPTQAKLFDLFPCIVQPTSHADSWRLHRKSTKNQDNHGSSAI